MLLSPRRLVLFVVTAALGAGIDQASKFYIFGNPDRFPLGELTPAVSPLFGVFPHVNYGALGGLGGDHPQLLILVSIAAMAVILWLFLTAKPHRTVTDIALGAMMAGAVGNLIDRLAYGHVRDFIKFIFLPDYPIFNIADACLLVGVFLMMAALIFTRRHTCPADAAAE